MRVRWARSRTPADIVLVARRSEVVVGLLGGRVRGAKAWLEWVEVDPGVEGEGVGTQLLAAYESVGAERGAERVYARAEPGDAGRVLPGGAGLGPGGPAAHGARSHRPGRLSGRRLRSRP